MLILKLEIVKKKRERENHTVDRVRNFRNEITLMQRKNVMKKNFVSVVL